MAISNYTTATEQIKEAILSSQYKAAKQVNAVQLSFYEAWQGLDTNLETTVSKLQISDNEGLINSATVAAELETNSAVATAEMPEQL